MLKHLCLFSVFICIFQISKSSASVQNNHTSDEINELKTRIQLLEDSLKSKPTKTQDKLFVFGSIRPALSYQDQATNPNTLSHYMTATLESRIGVKGERYINEHVTAFFNSEWKINYANSLEKPKTRQVFAGFDTTWGRIAFGKQQPAQYLLVGEYVDIFNNSGSPFAYDSVSPFFMADSINYSYHWNGVSFIAGGQVNGLEGSNYVDMVNFGAGYDNNDFHIGASYLQRTDNDKTDTHKKGDKNSIYGIAIANTFFDDFYLALAYQYIKNETLAGMSTNGKTIDLSAAYQLPKDYKLKAGYFLYDDGINTDTTSELISDNYQGFNITLEKQLTPLTRLHIEYLEHIYEEHLDTRAITVGMRYDFSQALL